MKLAAYAVASALLILGGAVTWVILRSEETRRDLRVVQRTVDPCRKPDSHACQRRIRLVLRELVERHPKALKRLGLVPRNPGRIPVSGGGGAAGSPVQGGGPVGRVRPPDPPDDEPPSRPPPDPPEPEPLIDLEAPVDAEVCVGGLVGVNCR